MRAVHPECARASRAPRAAAARGSIAGAFKRVAAISLPLKSNRHQNLRKKILQKISPSMARIGSRGGGGAAARRRRGVARHRALRRRDVEHGRRHGHGLGAPSAAHRARLVEQRARRRARRRRAPRRRRLRRDSRAAARRQRRVERVEQRGDVREAARRRSWLAAVASATLISRWRAPPSRLAARRPSTAPSRAGLRAPSTASVTTLRAPARGAWRSVAARNSARRRVEGVGGVAGRHRDALGERGGAWRGFEAPSIGASPSPSPCFSGVRRSRPGEQVVALPHTDCPLFTLCGASSLECSRQTS